MTDDSLRLTFLPSGLTVPAEKGETILDAALRHGIGIPHECGGNCSCTTCHVHILDGMDRLSPMEEPEAYRVQFAEELACDSRLACQALLLGGYVVARIPTVPAT